MKSVLLASLSFSLCLLAACQKTSRAEAEQRAENAEVIAALKQQLANAEEIAALKTKLAEAERAAEVAPAAPPVRMDVPQGKILKRTYHFKEADKPEHEYALYVPTGYDHGTPSPLVVLLHGLGSEPKQVIRYKGLVAEAERRGYIVVAPYGYNRNGWYGSQGPGNTVGFEIPEAFSSLADLPANLGTLSELDVLNVLDLMHKSFAVDPQRVYLMGHSMGGGGTLHLGMKYPEQWAALAPLAPAIYSSPDQLASIREMPVIMVQGEFDALVPVRNTRKWAAKMKELGMPHDYVEIKGGDHVNVIANSPKLMARLFDFFDKHQRP